MMIMPEIWQNLLLLCLWYCCCRYMLLSLEIWVVLGYWVLSWAGIEEVISLSSSVYWRMKKWWGQVTGWGSVFSSVLWNCCLGARKDTWPIKSRATYLQGTLEHNKWRKRWGTGNSRLPWKWGWYYYCYWFEVYTADIACLRQISYTGDGGIE